MVFERFWAKSSESKLHEFRGSLLGGCKLHTLMVTIYVQPKKMGPRIILCFAEHTL